MAKNIEASQLWAQPKSRYNRHKIAFFKSFWTERPWKKSSDFMKYEPLYCPDFSMIFNAQYCDQVYLKREGYEYDVRNNWAIQPNTNWMTKSLRFWEEGFKVELG